MPLSPAQKTAPSTSSSPAPSEHNAYFGMFLGMLAAVGYSCANLALRSVAIAHDPAWAIWVTCIKAIPVCVVAWVIIAFNQYRGQDSLPPRRLLVSMIAAALLMQFGGNFMFQWALGLGGLVLVVPMLFATLIISGAICGRIFVGDNLSTRTLFSMGLLILAIVVLSFGASDATGRVSQDASMAAAIGACVIAAISGTVYGANGVFIRHLRTVEELPLATSLVMFSTVGIITLGITSVFALGPERMLETTPRQWSMFSIAGWCNAGAFFALGAALRRASVNQVNLINASQNAMCAIGGVMFFSEPATDSLLIGCVLTIVGILLIDNKKKSPSADA